MDEVFVLIDGERASIVGTPYVPPEADVEAAMARLLSTNVDERSQRIGLEQRYPGQPRQKGGKFGFGKMAGSSTEGDGAAAIIPATPQWGELTDKQRANTVKSLCKKFGVGTKEELDAIVDANLDAARAAGHAADPRTRYFYPEAKELIGKLAAREGYDTETYTGAVAALSRQRAVKENLTDSVKIAKALKDPRPYELTAEESASIAKRTKGKVKIAPGTYDKASTPADQLAFIAREKGDFPNRDTGSMAAAVRIFRKDGTVDAELSGPKVRNFYNNLTDPTDPRWVTIDTWDLRAIAGSHKIHHQYKDNGPEEMTLSEWQAKYRINRTPEVPEGKPAIKAQNLFFGSQGGYSYFASRHQAVAERAGMLPHEDQALGWNGVRSGAGYRPTPISDLYSALGVSL